MKIQPDDPRRSDVVALVAEHLAEMHGTSPEESVHAMDVDALAHCSITVFSARDEDGTLLGIGALKIHDEQLGELKSMRTAKRARGRGVGGAVLDEIIAFAQAQGLSTLALETGTDPYFAAAHRLYARRGFELCEPFADYVYDVNSAFFALPLTPAALPMTQHRAAS